MADAKETSAAGAPGAEGQEKAEKPERPEKTARAPKTAAAREAKEGEAPEEGASARKAPGKKKEKKNIPFAIANVHASFNNAVITITDQTGNVLAWSSAGCIGFKGSRKGTPFAAQLAAQAAGGAARE